MPKIVIKHLTGVKAGQVESFELPLDAVTFGRSTDCQVAYDPLKEDLVSRNHLKITPQGEDAFLLTDLNSSNGTFVNDKQVTDPVTLLVGDTVQLGKGGPKFVFDLDPPPAAGKTRQAVSLSASKSTRQGESETKTGETSAKAAEPKKQGIGLETFERGIKETEKNTRRKMVNISAGIFTVIVLVAGYFVYQSQADKQEVLDTVGSSLTAVKTEQERKLAEMKANSPMSASEIARQFESATVFIETSWKLFHVETGKQLYHKTECVSIEANRPCVDIPVYVRNGDRVEPWLSLEPGEIIGSKGTITGSGFVSQDGGFILTNRHVVASWDTSYTDFKLPGLMMCVNATCKPDILQPDSPLAQTLLSWVPTEAVMLGNRPAKGKLAEGRHDFLEVTFPGTTLRFPARLVRVSAIADVAMIKIDVPQPLQAVQMDATTPVSAGDQVTVMGYPAISPDLIRKADSQDPFKQKGELRSIPEPTITPGNIGKVINNPVTNASNFKNEFFSEMGDAYQLTINATGPGNSGGPVFNDKGKVIGIFTSGRQRQGAMITFAVPIKYGLELMEVQKTIY